MMRRGGALFSFVISLKSLRVVTLHPASFHFQHVDTIENDGGGHEACAPAAEEAPKHSLCRKDRKDISITAINNCRTYGPRTRNVLTA